MNAGEGPVLRDIHLPPAPDWWPPAPGWWVLAAVALLSLAWLLLRWHRAHLRRRREHMILHELDRCVAENGRDAAVLAAALSRFLRRMALRETPAAAAYEGERWLEYLDARGATDQFRHGIGRVLVDAPYRAATSYDAAALIALVRRWTRAALTSGDAHA